jgi:hypothetical protein
MGKLRNLWFCADDALDLQTTWAEVNNESQWETGGLKIRERLLFVNDGDFRHCFQLQDDAIVNDQVQLETLNLYTCPTICTTWLRVSLGSPRSSAFKVASASARGMSTRMRKDLAWTARMLAFASSICLCA